MPEEQTIKFEVTVTEANLLLQALGELPAKVSMGLIAKLQSQAAPQVKETPAVEPEVVK